MIQFIRNILGLGPSEPSYLINESMAKPVKSIYINSKTLNNQHQVFPILASEKTKEFNLNNQLASIFYEREGLYSRLLQLYVVLDNKDEVSQIRTENEDDDFFSKLELTSLNNLDNFNLLFADWNLSGKGKKINFKILSTTVSFFSSELIMSKKRMLEAHTILESKEIMVSIPRRGLIFICDKNLKPNDISDFYNLHRFIILEENVDLEILCEDIFILENGEIKEVFKYKELSKYLIKNNK